jgi:hypothetical protein
MGFMPGLEGEEDSRTTWLGDASGIPIEPLWITYGIRATFFEAVPIFPRTKQKSLLTPYIFGHLALGFLPL